ncbi:hypothetical protein B0T26DRAFT_495366 [Lasiosphaeria miniovina]|uniref:Uncharacterized protein n=1 Tax=Lasiosphaeria miniovina TaxID=1954250 RepID=A0AA39ZTG7_9PEZI|nr:uncharacterized protein B0T26DRAFT_495366 [Lasiosphaeria miniovina]KAK0703316.1 hypothetical protein B0T26DRAFT_495366 [Lasiosphaeria miniovina]
MSIYNNGSLAKPESGAGTINSQYNPSVCRSQHSYRTGNTVKSECHSKCMSAVNVYCLLEEPSKNYLRPWTRSLYLFNYGGPVRAQLLLARQEGAAWRRALLACRAIAWCQDPSWHRATSDWPSFRLPGAKSPLGTGHCLIGSRRAGPPVLPEAPASCSWSSTNQVRHRLLAPGKRKDGQSEVARCQEGSWHQAMARHASSARRQAAPSCRASKSCALTGPP